MGLERNSLALSLSWLMSRASLPAKSLSLDPHHNDVTAVDFLVLNLLILVRHRRETALETALLVHGGSHQEVAEKQERDVGRRLSVQTRCFSFGHSELFFS